MKKLLSLILVIVMVACIATVSVSADAAKTFKAGDKLYLKVISPSQWMTPGSGILYANFTEYSRADNGNVSVIIESADKSKYDPVTGAVYDEENDIYCYTVTESDANAACMRFWRGSTEKLWNCSVLLTAEDYASGNNLVIVNGTQWDDSGSTDKYYSLNINPEISLSATTGDIGDSFTATVTGVSVADEYNVAYSISANNTVVSDTDTYTFTADAKGIINITATVTVTDATGAVVGIGTASQSVTIGAIVVTPATSWALYAHGVSDSGADSEAWVRWYTVGSKRYFFLPSSVSNDGKVEIYNAYASDVTIKSGSYSVTIPSGELAVINYTVDQDYTVTRDSNTYTAVFKKSSAEAAVFINNTDSFDGADLMSYLKASKSNYAAATGAITDKDGNINNEGVKKIKGRGNTSWNAAKKGFNITYNSAVKVGSMQKCKKFSIISNFQDATLCRNRLLYDLADAVGVPYASDSRFIDFYVNGVYQGNYLICEKVDVGKNTLISDVSSDDYLDKTTNGVKDDFSFVCEIDAAPSEDDFYFKAGNGNSLTMKSPEVETTDPNYGAVKSYIKAKYDKMYTKLNTNAADTNDYIDIESLAQVYLINELGKNWDSGAGSFYFVYKPDKNGNYKFFASPVWDYDNSLGNANGVSSDLKNLGISDYTLPTGWFCTKKNGYVGPNFLTQAMKNDLVKEKAVTVWFEQFVPALETLSKTGISSGELFSPDVYKEYLAKSADMNYLVWDMIVDSGWIANHSSLKKCSVNYTYNKYGQITGVSYKQATSSTSYNQYSFSGEFDYMIDWTKSRAAWISSQYIDSYTPTQVFSDVIGDANENFELDIIDATYIQRHLALLLTLTPNAERLSDVDDDGRVTIMDATRIQRVLAQIDPPFENRK